MTATPSVETILLVEDDELIRRLILRTLKGHGYQVLSAGDGHEALILVEDPCGPIDLLVTDVVMPGIDGFTLAERLVESHPETRVLFLTGYADQSVAIRGWLKEARQAFLLKPFAQDRLLGTIRNQLDTNAGRGPDAERNTVVGLVD